MADEFEWLKHAAQLVLEKYKHTHESKYLKEFAEFCADNPLLLKYLSEEEINLHK